MIIRKNTPISVILADSNPLVLSAMSEVFERDSRFSVVATTATAEGFLTIVTQVPVQMGVIEWPLPLLGGARLIDTLRQQENAPKIVVYAEESPDSVRLAMASGAAGFTPRSAQALSLLTTCVEVASGKMVFPYIDVRDLQRDPIANLSRRERTILHALAKGLTNRELSKNLGISLNTVKFHLSNLYEKLGFKNRSQAIAFFYASRLEESHFDK